MTGQGIVEQFLALKEGTDADLLAMQCGDFYEFFADDAERVAAELDLKISQKSSHGSSYPMAGVPIDDLTPYLKALVERGFRVAVADQYETDGGDLAREITRVATPGTLVETSDDAAQYLAAVVSGDGAAYGLAFADVTTGRFLVTEAETAADAHAELYRFDPVELLPGPEVRTDDDFLRRVREGTDASLALFDTEQFASGRARHALREQFGRETLDSVGVDSDLAVRAAGAVLAYVAETGVGVAQSMTRLRAYEPGDHLNLDATTQRNLELTETMHGERAGSLLDAIDHTVTSPGGRLLREWLTRPRRDREELTRRHDCVEALAAEALARERVRDTLDGAYDLERLASRAASGRAGAQDMLSIRDTLAILPAVADAVAESALADSPLSAVVVRPDRDAAAALREELAAALAENPPKTTSQGGLFERGYDDELDDLIERHEDARGWIEGLADREKSKHGIVHVTVDRNKTDGYYIQVGKSEIDEVPDEYREIKTLKNSKRYTTDELDERERTVLRLEEARADLERELFEELREQVAAESALLQDVGRTLAEVDALASLATHAAGNDWVRPELTDPGPLRIEAGRHPVVERTTEFVPNDLRMDGAAAVAESLCDSAGSHNSKSSGDVRQTESDAANRTPTDSDDASPERAGGHASDERGFLIVTGPNMSGKSTYMRQAALIVLLAQVGSFVPARSATVGLVDGIYTRVGALDELAQGRSTFMVEMQELSNILHSATDESLVILDEVGRGTSTYDGISIAWAATEYLHNEVRAKTLFATHYHELTTLADHLDRVANVHVAVAGEPRSTASGHDSSAAERDGDVTFLRTVEEGPTDRSYGIHVADLAGVPAPVVDRANEVLGKLRAEQAVEAKGGSGGGGGSVQAVFDLDAGQFRTAASDGGSAAAGRGSGAETAGGDTADAADPGRSDGADAVLSDLRDLDVNDATPVEVLTRVQEWQSKLEGDDE